MLSCIHSIKRRHGKCKELQGAYLEGYSYMYRYSQAQVHMYDTRVSSQAKGKSEKKTLTMYAAGLIKRISKRVFFLLVLTQRVCAL
jgi:hypothetical protein